MSQHRVELLRKRADDWKRRERKWHTQLERERAWASAAPVGAGMLAAVAAAAVAVNATGVWSIPLASAWPAIALVVGSAWQYRGGVARNRLDAAKLHAVWLAADRAADRAAEFYRSIISRLDDGCEVGLLVAESDEFEKGARAA